MEMAFCIWRWPFASKSRCQARKLHPAESGAWVVSNGFSWCNCCILILLIDDFPLRLNCRFFFKLKSIEAWEHIHTHTNMIHGFSWSFLEVPWIKPRVHAPFLPSKSLLLFHGFNKSLQGTSVAEDHERGLIEESVFGEQVTMKVFFVWGAMVTFLVKKVACCRPPTGGGFPKMNFDGHSC